jgi:membrane associated rhomboid family serine protease
MWFLSLFGDNVEDAMGRLRFISFYLLCGFGAIVMQLVSNPSSPLPMVGASGAIGGVMGGYALLYPKAPVHILVFLGFFFVRVIVPAYLMLGYWFLLQLLSTLPGVDKASGGIAFWAHIGGFLTGVILVKVFCNSKQLAICRGKKGVVSHLIEKIS